MSEKTKPVLPEWGIHLRNLIDRMAPVVNDHHRDLEAQRAKVQLLEQQVAQTRTLQQQQATAIGLLQARLVALEQKVSD